MTLRTELLQVGVQRGNAGSGFGGDLTHRGSFALAPCQRVDRTQDCVLVVFELRLPTHRSLPIAGINVAIVRRLVRLDTPNNGGSRTSDHPSTLPGLPATRLPQLPGAVVLLGLAGVSRVA